MFVKKVPKFVFCMGGRGNYLLFSIFQWLTPHFVVFPLDEPLFWRKTPHLQPLVLSCCPIITVTSKAEWPSEGVNWNTTMSVCLTWKYLTKSCSVKSLLPCTCHMSHWVNDRPGLMSVLVAGPGSENIMMARPRFKKQLRYSSSSAPFTQRISSRVAWNEKVRESELIRTRILWSQLTGSLYSQNIQHGPPSGKCQEVPWRLDLMFFCY